MWICDGNNTEQLCIKPYGFLVSIQTNMDCVHVRIAQLNVFMIIYTIIIWTGREYHNMHVMRMGVWRFYVFWIQR